jgi:hypothetical protein
MPRVPVCSPFLFARFEGVPAEKLLQSAPLVHVTSVTEDWEWWFGQSRIKPPRGGQDVRFTQYAWRSMPPCRPSASSWEASRLSTTTLLPG